MSKTIEQIEQELDAKIKESSIVYRNRPGSRYTEQDFKRLSRDEKRDVGLSYLEGWQVIDRLNKIFGPLNWDKEILDVKEVVNKTSKGEFPAYLVKVRLTVTKPDADNKYTGSCSKEAYGYGADKSSQNAHELAIKEAVTDALKVAAKDFGMSLGLALYDKEQVNVDDDEPEHREVPKAKVPEPKKVARAAEKASGEAPSPKAGASDIPAPAQTSDDTTKLKLLIRTELKNAITLGVTTMGDMQDKLLSQFGVMKLDHLDKTQLDTVLNQVKSLTHKE